MKRKTEAHDFVIQCLTEATIQLMEKKPFSEITISELCEKAGVSRVSYYRNFDSLQDILTKYLIKCTDSWWKKFIKKTEQDFYNSFWTELLDQYKKQKNLIMLLFKNNISYLLKDHIFSCCGPKPEQEPHTAYICAILAGAIYGLVDEWIHRGMNDVPDTVSFREMVKIAHESHMNNHQKQN